MMTGRDVPETFIRYLFYTSGFLLVQDAEGRDYCIFDHTTVH